MTEPDYHRLRAAEMFGVAPESVTAEQRAAAKLENFRATYGTLTPPVQDSRGRTPRVLLQEADGGWELRDQWQRHRIWWWQHRPSAEEMRSALRSSR